MSRSDDSTTQLHKNQRFQTAEHVLTAVEGTRTELLDIEEGQLYGLDGVASAVWEMLSAGASLDDVVHHVRGAFDSPGDIDGDVERFMRELLAASLIVPLDRGLPSQVQA